MKKGEFDHTYFEPLGKTKFSLCPKGGCKWTYRFIESCFCGAIPIVKRPTDEKYQKGITFYVDGRDEPKYNKEIAKSNLISALNNHTLATPQQIKELSDSV